MQKFKQKTINYKDIYVKTIYIIKPAELSDL